MGRHTETASLRTNRRYAVAAGAVCVLIVAGVAGAKALTGGGPSTAGECDKPPADPRGEGHRLARLRPALPGVRA
ncbi:hypothetical protein [Leekyejoonella antrihumi]|uniref:Uncharacterized protein n=1 Tax=Leekyejoonella antrihumi TaxID=1660198 RepID=A0A563EA08_9MICO|nr:hypothetical protein [Leekyejoonella antrihumi]TWP38624.1 hypothetical protein FGL98_02230 [Leekyejoonella antrihumi]